LRVISVLLIISAIITACSSQPAGDSQSDLRNNANTANAEITGPVLSGDPVINRFSVSPSTIPPGGKAILSWDVSNAVSVTINNNIGRVNSKGSVEVTPAVQTTYVITATNQKGSAFARVILTVQDASHQKLPAIEEFRTDPEYPRRGKPAKLIWKTSGATQVTINDVPVQLSGDKTIMLITPTIYTIMATNSFGSEIKYLSVSISE
jgi:hypothetical protein